jgi:phospholipid-binding lipoprotein MlaA
MRPAIQFYIDVVPQPIRQAVSNFFNNIDDLISAMNDLLQGDLDRFGNDMGRVIFNTAWGFGVHRLGVDGRHRARQPGLRAHVR